MQKLIVQKEEAGQRLDRFLLRYMEQAGSAFIYRMLRKKNITLNGKKAEGSERLAENDTVTLFLSDETVDKFRTQKKETPAAAKPEGIRLDVVYEDADVLIANKPYGLLTQKAAAEDYSLNDLILDYLRETETGRERGTGFTPSVCNRLDRNTSGLVTAGKSLAGSRFLNGLFRERTVDKYYVSVVCGRVEKAVRLSGWLAKDEATNTVTVSAAPREGADRIVTEIVPKRFYNGFTLVGLKLLTGKSHQLRAVMQSIGHPVLGDPKYGDEKINAAVRGSFPLRRQLLHAETLVFPELSGDFARLSNRRFTAPLPQDFASAVKALGLESEHG